MFQTIANVIIPAFTVPYAASFLFPVAGFSVLIAECIVIKLMEKALSQGRVIYLVIVMNIVSTFIGTLISAFLPDGMESRIMGSGENQVAIAQPGENWTNLMYIAFPVAYVLSVLIEYGVAKNNKRFPMKKPFRAVAAANTASYLALIAVSYVWAYHIW